MFAAICYVHGEAQFAGYPQYWQNPELHSWRTGISPSLGQDARFLTGIFTYTVSTTTTVAVTTATTTCTFSTAALTACVASGGRKKRNVSSEAALMHDVDESYDSSVFVKVDDSEPAAASSVQTAPSQVEKRSASPLLPLAIQPGINVPNSLRSARFLLTLGTGTVTSTSTSTYTARLSAICLSTTNFNVC